VAAIFFLNQPQQKIEDAKPQPAPVEHTTASAPATDKALPPETPVAPTPTLSQAATQPGESMASEVSEPEQKRIEPLGLAEQLPGTKPVPPNTTEQLKEELKYIWTYPLSPLPAPLKAPQGPRK
jgi:hypothetical protein